MLTGIQTLFALLVRVFDTFLPVSRRVLQTLENLISKHEEEKINFSKDSTNLKSLGWNAKLFAYLKFDRVVNERAYLTSKIESAQVAGATWAISRQEHARVDR